MSNELIPNKENMVQFNVRIPEFVKRIMEKAGKLNSRSQNQEAIYRLNNFTSHEAMIQEIRKDMYEIKNNQVEILNEIKALRQESTFKK
ncbi:Arc family DNA-binding protein [Acinetobacter variabilis]|uniref:Arc family DNA-binding protein n=1 Tax=Acinetobacter variabilis TaxID=70346 RepID=UPI003B83FDE4